MRHLGYKTRDNADGGIVLLCSTEIRWGNGGGKIDDMLAYILGIQGQMGRRQHVYLFAVGYQPEVHELIIRIRVILLVLNFLFLPLTDGRKGYIRLNTASCLFQHRRTPVSSDNIQFAIFNSG